MKIKFKNIFTHKSISYNSEPMVRLSSDATVKNKNLHILGSKGYGSNRRNADKNINRQ